VEPLNRGLREDEESFASKAMLLKEYSCCNILQIAIHARQKIPGSCEVYQCKVVDVFLGGVNRYKPFHVSWNIKKLSMMFYLAFNYYYY